MKKVYLFTPTEGRTEDINNYISAAANILRAMFENRGEEIEIVTNFNLEPAGTDADGERITKIRNCDNPILYMSEELALIDACDYVAKIDQNYGFALGFSNWSELADCDGPVHIIDDKTIYLDPDFLPQATVYIAKRPIGVPLKWSKCQTKSKY